MDLISSLYIWMTIISLVPAPLIKSIFFTPLTNQQPFHPYMPGSCSGLSVLFHWYHISTYSLTSEIKQTQLNR